MGIDWAIAERLNWISDCTGFSFELVSLLILSEMKPEQRRIIE